MNSHASLILFWESLNNMVICFGYKFSPNMIDIQEGYTKNFNIKCIEYYEKFDSLWLFWDIIMCEIRVRLVSSFEFEKYLC